MGLRDAMEFVHHDATDRRADGRDSAWIMGRARTPIRSGHHMRDWRRIYLLYSLLKNVEVTCL